MNQEKILSLHQLIAGRMTGCPEEAAQKLGISRATLFRYIHALKELGADIIWVHFLKTYIYANDFEIRCPRRRMYVYVDGKETLHEY